MFKHSVIATSMGLAGALSTFPAFAQMAETEQQAAPSVQNESASTYSEAPAAENEAPATSDAAVTASQPAAATPREPAIEEIVVTARRRSESIQNVPIAVTAISGDALARANVTDVNAIATQVPSLLIVSGSSGSKAIPTFAIRGQSQQELTVLADPSVPVYFNDVVVERQQGINSSLFDIQSVEVLKGPQGTLFGRNSTGGAINIKANTPGKDFDGYVGTTFGNLGRFNTTGMVNLPLTSWAQLRVAGQTTDSDGYLKDVVLDKEINYEHTKAARVSLALQPIEGMNSLFTYSRFIENDGGTGAEIVNLNPGSAANSTSPSLGYIGSLNGEQMLADQKARGIYKTASGADQYTRVSTRDIANTTTYDINDTLSIKNIVGNRRVTGSNFDDVDGMPIPLIQINRYYNFNQISEEFQLLGKTDTLNWIVGAYYFHESGGTDDYSVTVKPANASPGNAIPQPIPLEFPGWTLTDPNGKNTSKSVFAQATQKLDMLLDGLAFTVGGRYTWDDRESIIGNRAGNASDPNGPQTCGVNLPDDGDPDTPAVPYPIDQCRFAFKKSFSEPTWNVSLDYQFTKSNLVYLANRRGYRTGGFGARANTVAALAKTYNPEIVTDYELGSKNDFNIGGVPLRLNADVYYSKYKDIQRLLTDPTLLPVQTVPVNAARATIKGAEVEFTILPTENTEISGFYSYTDAGYDKFIDPQTGADRSNQPFARSPKNVYSITARYSLPIPSELGNVSAQANYFHTDGYSTSDTYAPEQIVHSYALLNLRADWKSIYGSSFDIGAFMDNALDKKYLNSFGDIYDPAVIGIITRTPGAPRTFGMDIRYRFGAQGT